MPITNDLLNIATSGLRTQQQLLQTTGNNIANVNTEGYVRQRTVFESEVSGGVGQGYTNRVLDQFALNQLRRDTSIYSELDAYLQKSELLDGVFANAETNLSGSISQFFASLQTAADEPNNMAARSLVLGEGESLLGHFEFLSGYMSNLEKELNFEFDATTERANSLIEKISSLNNQITLTTAANSSGTPGVLADQRDQAILELSELVAINTQNLEDGRTLVYLDTGQALVMQDGTFNMFDINGNPDLMHKQIELLNNSRGVSIKLPDSEIGGRLGGLFTFRDEILTQSQRQLGQLALALGDAVNQQNHKGLDLDGQLGGDIFKLPSIGGMEFDENSNQNLQMNVRVEAGRSNEITTADYRVTITNVAGGPPSTADLFVEAVNPDGSVVKDIDGNDINFTYTGVETGQGNWISIDDGLQLELPDGAAYAPGDAFLLQPTKYAADLMNMQTTRGEDLALASPIIVNSNISNLGDTEIINSVVTNTTIDATNTDPETSAFTSPAGIQGPGAAPGGTVGAPVEVYFTSANSFELRDSAGTTIVTVSGTNTLENILEQGAAQAGWPAAWSALNDYPGYDFSLQGVPQAGDSFTLSFNTDGTDDNRNGLLLANLDDVDTMRRNASAASGGRNQFTFHEAFSTTVGTIGERVASADIAFGAAEAMQRSSESWYESVSGVSLDEEAANLVRFQQAYSASARVLSTAQTLFDTILSAAR